MMIYLASIITPIDYLLPQPAISRLPAYPAVMMILVIGA